MKTAVLTVNMCDNPAEYGGRDEWYVNDLHLAAELGKGLLDRNVELENNMRQQQQLIEDQAQEIQMLSRQSIALKEINESRFRVYEQLEASISDLENTNQQLREEMSSDKKRAKSLCQSVDVLENKCLELQELVDNFKVSEKKRRSRHKTSSLWTSTSSLVISDDHSGHTAHNSPLIPLQRRHSFQDQDCEEDPEWAVRLRSTVSKLKCQLAKEETTCNDLRAQVQILLQENSQHLEQQKQLEEQRERLIFYHQAERLYWSCMHCRRSRVETQQEDEESDDSLLASSESFSLVELENGSLAYGDGDSLNGTLLDTASLPVDRNRISLLSELDSQYRAIIKKYEDLVLSSGSPSLDCSDSTEDHAKETSLFRSLSTCSSGVSSFQEDEDEGGTPTFEDRCVQTEVQECKEIGSDSPFKQLFDDIFAVLKRSVPQESIIHLPKTLVQATMPAPISAKSRVMEVNLSATKKRDIFMPYRQRKSVACDPYCVPVPSLTGFPLFKLPGMHSYAQVVKMNPRLLINSSFIK